MSDPQRVALVHLGRDHAMGDVRRVRAWQAILRAGGHEVLPLRLLPDHKAGALALARQAPKLLLGQGDVVPEAGIWDWHSAAGALSALDPDAVVCVTSRCYVPAFARLGRPLVLDLVDRLGASYRDRAQVDGSWPRRTGYRFLARRHEAAEGADRRELRLVAAGYSEAAGLRATWVPNVVEPVVLPDGAGADHDLCFVGTLRYPPNVEAVLRLDRLWDDLLRARPGTTLLLAGSRPVPEVVEVARRRGWELLADFEDLGSVLASARLSIAPVSRTSGLQNKVLDAAAAGVAQVVDPAALAGFDPDLPVRSAGDDASLVAAVVELLDDETARSAEAATARAHVLARYSAEAWAAPVTGLLQP